MTTLPIPQKETALDILRPRRPMLEAMLSPKSVALIGATEAHGSVGRALMENLQGNEFDGELFPVNPKREVVLGRPAYPAIGDIPDPVDLAVICTPAATVPQIIDECGKAGV